ncbi:MAG TPA: ABC transporter substrate-binding protein [Polyangia bacterium]|jgi:phospholipid transport system substrate-binding protein|nr:ABC transporter substrate-binding protein [Polyangia bacterium]
MQELRRVDALVQSLGSRRLPAWSPEADARRMAMQRELDQLIDFEEICHRALGPSWSGVPADKRGEFVKTLRTLAGRTYVDALTSGRDYRVVLDRQIINGSEARVTGTRTRRSPGAAPIAVEYCLVLRQGRWRVADVIVDGSSLVANYHREFARVIKRESFDGLLASMKERLRRSDPN